MENNNSAQSKTYAAGKNSFILGQKMCIKQKLREHVVTYWISIPFNKNSVSRLIGLCVTLRKLLVNFTLTLIYRKLCLNRIQARISGSECNRLIYRIKLICDPEHVPNLTHIRPELTARLKTLPTTKNRIKPYSIHHLKYTIYCSNLSSLLS